MKNIAIGGLMALAVLARAQESSYVIQKRLIGSADGLPDRNVNCGIQDKFGFLWFGTRSGLCYYDGSQFVFLNKKTHGLRGTSILSLVEDDSVGIIITYALPGSSGVNSHAFDVVNIKTKEVLPFERYYSEVPFEEESVQCVVYRRGKPLIFLLENERSYKWEWTSHKGFVRKKIDTMHLSVETSVFANPTDSAILKANVQLNKDLILSRDSTLISFNSNQQVIVEHGGGYLISYRDFTEEQGNVLYYMSYQGEMSPIDAGDEVAWQFSKFPVYIPSYNFEENGLVISPYTDQKTAILELEDRSIVFYAPKVGFINLFRPEDNLRVKSFFQDRLGAWWLSTSMGLYKLTAKKKLFQTSFTRDNPRFSFNNSTRGIYVDDEVTCVNLYDSQVIIANGDTTMLRISENFAAVRTTNALWIGNYSPIKFDIKSGNVTIGASTEKGEIWSFFTLSDSLLLIGCTNGIGVYDVIKDRILDVNHNKFPPAQFVYKIFRNSEGYIMAVAENGIYLMSDALEVFDLYAISATSKEKMLPCASVQDVYEDKDGVYWIASSQEGLFRWDRTDHSFEQFGIESGFLTASICRIEEDDYNNLWVSTDNGLVKFDKALQRALTFTKEDGIADDEFNRSSSFKDQYGKIYFGGMNGVTSFDPTDFVKGDEEKIYEFPLIEFTWFNSTTGAMEVMTEEAYKHGGLVLNDAIKIVSLKFILLDYEDRHHRYAYQMEGLDEDWNYTGNNRIQVGNLPYGEYTLKVKAQLADGSWNQQQIELWVKMEAPFYKKWWFRGVLAIFAGLLVLLIVTLRTRVLRRQKAKLEQVIEERTQELNLSLIEQKIMLQEIHHRVKNNLQFIEAIIGMQINVAQTESNEMVLMDINRRIHSMTIVHEMLYNKDKLESISVSEYIRDMVDKLVGMVSTDRKVVQLNMQIDDVQLNMNNCLAIGMITSELISNAFKHAFEDANDPEINISLSVDSESETIHYTIRDNGSGLPGNKKTNGLGLRLIDIFVRQLSGNYKIYNQNGLSFDLVFSLSKVS